MKNKILLSLIVIGFVNNMLMADELVSQTGRALNLTPKLNSEVPALSSEIDGEIHLLGYIVPLLGVSGKLWIHNKVGLEAGVYTILIFSEVNLRILWKPYHNKGFFIAGGISQLGMTFPPTGRSSTWATISFGIRKPIGGSQKLNSLELIILPIGYNENGWQWGMDNLKFGTTIGISLLGVYAKF